ncbi:HNH endonuclease [Shewanella sp. 10N.286.45.A1]|uniref:HNH endonuclease n=1 Tax=Shewanella sp. 10N.286.45.A1 TaxID=3229694 RepID=UPI003550ADDD
MVANVTLPSDDSLETINTVLAERQKFLGFYRSITNDLRDQVESYIEHNGDPTLVQPLNLRNYTDTDVIAAKRKKTLINLYSPKPTKIPFLILEKMRNEHGLLFCPSCGEDGAPGTLDHYLPKTEFPELSVCLVNLTPMCSKCQGKKSDDYLTVDNEKAFLHPYYDQIDDCLFHINIRPPFNNPSCFSIELKDSVTGDFRGLVESHIEGIDFINRIEGYCESKHLHLLKLMAEEREDEEPLSAEQLIRRYLRQEKKKALNAWGAIYYQSVLDSPDLLVHLNDGQLPEYL